MKKIVFADIGNTRIKIFDGIEFLSCSYNENDLLNLKSYLFNNSIEKIYYSSVNAQAEFKIRELVDIDITDISEIISNQKIVNFDKISGMGVDRKLSLFGAISKSLPPIITIDCGTAITINVLNANYECEGGVIFPGIALQERALKEMTSGLKNFELVQTKESTGKNTSEAISSGIFNGIANAVSGLLLDIIAEKFNNQNVNIFLTGGSSVLILPLIKSKFEYIYEEKLNILGMMYLVNKSGLI